MQQLCGVVVLVCYSSRFKHAWQHVCHEVACSATSCPQATLLHILASCCSTLRPLGHLHPLLPHTSMTTQTKSAVRLLPCLLHSFGDAFDNLFKSKVFQSEIAVREFDT